MRPFFITAAGTDVGKTLVMTALCWQFHQQQKKVTALKPVISGFDPNDPESDIALILKSCGLTPTQAMMETISPWRFAAPISPNMAAAKEKQKIDVDKVVKFCRDHTGLADIVLVEGAGGVMAPIADGTTMLDCMVGLDWPVILVTGTYVGALSHTLTAMETLKSRGVKLHAIVVSESKASTVSLADTVATLETFVSKDVSVIKIPRLTAKDELWKHVPLINWICADE